MTLSSPAGAPEFHPDHLMFVPLGGAGEIGMNLNLYGLDGKWIILDLGIGFDDGELPGVDVVLPDPAFIAERRESLLGIVVTHAHEDHIGAVQYLWPQLRCPVYATPFAAALLRKKLVETGLLGQVPIIEVPLGGALTLGPFDLEFITITHSIPEPNAVALHTRHGTVLHTGDWKLDPEPVIGDVTDEAKLRTLGEAGVLAMVCDSTNVFREGHSGSEAHLLDTFDDLIGSRRGIVAVTTFATNIARIESIARTAARHDRHVVLAGRSLWRVTEAAKETGYLADIAPFLSDRDAGYLPRDKTLIICTGCQGEPRAALSRIAAGDHPHIALDRGDTVIFSSRIIPGNEPAIFRLENRLLERGIEVLTEQDHDVHVSGHPARDELVQMYQWVKPRIAVPVHGELRHLVEHAALAAEMQVSETVVMANGRALRLAPGPAEVVGQVPVGRLAIDGRDIVPVDSEGLRERRRLSFEGVASATIVVDRGGRLMTDPRISVHGLPEAVRRNGVAVSDAVRDAIIGLRPDDRLDDEAVREAARLAIRRAFKKTYERRPTIMIELVRL